METKIIKSLFISLIPVCEENTENEEFCLNNGDFCNDSDSFDIYGFNYSDRKFVVNF